MLRSHPNGEERESGERSLARHLPTDPKTSPFFGLDLGQRNDYSAIAILDLVEDISAVRRFPLGTAYTDIPARVRESAGQPPPGHLGRPPKSTLAVDAGGPGLPVVELLRQASLDCSLLPAIVTGGHMGSLLPGGMYSVPRKELVNLLRLTLESRMLVFPAGLPLREELAAELAAVESAGGQSEHDDMAIAIALALWATTKRQPGLIQKKAA